MPFQFFPESTLAATVPIADLKLVSLLRANQAILSETASTRLHKLKPANSTVDIEKLRFLCGKSFFAKQSTYRPMASGYQYRRIDLATDGIRLLRLVKGSRNDIMKCELFESYLHTYMAGAATASEGVPYEALSYTWGRSMSPVKIWHGFQYIEVAENLYCALQKLRYDGKDRILWIDALCIARLHLESDYRY